MSPALISVLQNSCAWLREALFPSRCIFCFGLGPVVHNECANLAVFSDAIPVIDGLDELFIGYDYDDPQVKKIIEYFKFRGMTDLTPFLAQQLGERGRIKVEGWKEDSFKSPPFNSPLVQGGGGLVLISIPLHWTRRWWRGFNQAESLARGLGKVFDLQVSTDLKRTKRTQQQARLDKVARRKNMDQAFAWRGSTVPEAVILVDDVLTSGATMAAAATVLREAGVKRVYGLVWAKGK